MWLIVLHIPVTAVPSPAQMLYVSAEIRTVGVGPPPHTRWLALLRLFLVLTYLLLSFWESCEFEKGKKKRLPQQLTEKKILRRFLFTYYLKTQRMYSRSVLNLLRTERNQEIGAVRYVESSLVSKQHQRGQLGQCSLCSRDRRRHTSDQIAQHFGWLPVSLRNEEQVFSTLTLSFLNQRYLKDGKSV